MKLKTVLGIVAVATLGMTVNTGTAYAAPSFCVPGPNTDTLSLSDVTFRGNAADDCYGVLGDDSLTESEVTNIWNILVNPDFKYGTGNFGNALYANDDSITFNGLNWDFDLHTSNDINGTWDLEITEVGAAGPFPQTLDILFIIQDDDTNPNKWAFYLFNDETFTNTNDIDANHFEIGWMNGNSTPKYDKALLMFRNGTPGGTGTPGGQSVVPEPASLLLLGSGLAAAARARRKKAQQAE